MPALNYKAEFAEAVENGTKRSTIRPQRKNPIKPGDILYQYTGQRTKNSRKLGEHICTSVEPIEIEIDVDRGLNTIRVNGRTLTYREQHALAQEDGFEGVISFYKFFVRQYGLSPNNPLSDMVLIKWAPEAIS